MAIRDSLPFGATRKMRLTKLGVNAGKDVTASPIGCTHFVEPATDKKSESAEPSQSKYPLGNTRGDTFAGDTPLQTTVLPTPGEITRS